MLLQFSPIFNENRSRTNRPTVRLQNGLNSRRYLTKGEFVYGTTFTKGELRSSWRLKCSCGILNCLSVTFDVPSRTVATYRDNYSNLICIMLLCFRAPTRYSIYRPLWSINTPWLRCRTLITKLARSNWVAIKSSVLFKCNSHLSVRNSC